MLALVGLTYRFAPLARSSEVVLVDLKNGRLVGRRWLPAPRHDLTFLEPPPGGGRQRGVRGVATARGLFFVATFDAIHVFDQKLRPQGSVTCDLFCDIHEFLVTDFGFVVTSTRMDAVVWCTAAGTVTRLWCATEDTAVAEAFPEVRLAHRPRDVDWRSLFPTYNPTHLNAVCEGDGRTLVALHNQAVLWCVEERRIWHDARVVGAGKTHNHRRLAGGAIVMNDTLHGRFLRWQQGQVLEIDVSAPGRCSERPPALSAPWALAHGWLRGLAMAGTSQAVVGQCPASLAILDLSQREVSRVLAIDCDWRVSVNGLALVPA
jgi:hypothetical protein